MVSWDLLNLPKGSPFLKISSLTLFISFMLASSFMVLLALHNRKFLLIDFFVYLYHSFKCFLMWFPPIYQFQVTYAFQIHRISHFGMPKLSLFTLILHLDHWSLHLYKLFHLRLNTWICPTILHCLY